MTGENGLIKFFEKVRASDSSGIILNFIFHESACGFICLIIPPYYFLQ